MKTLSSLVSNKFDESFLNIANYLMNVVVIISNNNESFRMTELEFYFKSKSHEDNSTHGCEMQKTSNRFYFHRYKSCFVYKKGNRKGLDITFGNSLAYGGILIRAIKSIDNDSYTYGPSLVVDKLLSNQYNDENLKTIESKKINDVDNEIYCKEYSLEEKELYHCPRVHLPKHTDEDYIIKDYRFFSYPTQKHYGKSDIIKHWTEHHCITIEAAKEIFQYKT